MPITPRRDDVIISRQVHSPAVHVLGRRGGPLQASYRTYGEALKTASSFAVDQHLDVWFTADEHTFDRVAQHRPTRVKPGALP
jgi:hypothetical protein